MVTRIVPSLSRYSLRLTIGSLPSQNRLTRSRVVTLGRATAQGRELAAGDVDLLLQGGADLRAGDGAGLGRPVEGLDGLHPALLAGGIEDHRVAHGDGAGIDGSRHDASIVTLLGELVHVLNRHPEPAAGGGSVWNASSASRTVGPSYHGRLADRSAMLSPPRPDTGMNAEGLIPTWSRKAPYSRTIRS